MAMSSSSRTSGINITGEIITLVVGPKGDKLKVHDTAVRPRSKFFDVALSKPWIESRERCIKLPEDKIEIVTLYVQNVYSTKFFVSETTQAPHPFTDANLPQYYTLAEMYLFGEKIDDIRFKNAVLDGFVVRMQTSMGRNGKWYPVTAIVDIIYQGTMPGSLARKLMVDAHAEEGSCDWIPKEPDYSNKEFLVDLTRAMFKKRSKPHMGSPLTHAIAKGTYHEAIKPKHRT